MKRFKVKVVVRTDDHREQTYTLEFYENTPLGLIYDTCSNLANGAVHFDIVSIVQVR